MTVEIVAASFCVIATLPSGFRVRFGQRQTHPRQAGRSRVKRDEMRLRLVHEESQRGKLDEGGRSPPTIMVPSWQHGQRERSTRLRQARFLHPLAQVSRLCALFPDLFFPHRDVDTALRTLRSSFLQTLASDKLAGRTQGILNSVIPVTTGIKTHHPPGYRFSTV